MRRHSWLTLCVCASGAPLAEAWDVERFSNSDGKFEWVQFVAVGGGPGVTGDWLDITENAEQSGAAGATSVACWRYNPLGSLQMTPVSAVCSPLAGAVHVATSTVPMEVCGAASRCFEVFRCTTFPVGGVIGPSAHWAASGDIAWRQGFGPEHPLLGTDPSLGMRIVHDSAVHYGWIRLHWNGERYVPTGWAYELEPNVAVVVDDSFCAAEFDGDGVADVHDCFAFIDAFLAGDENADFDNSGMVNSSDFFAFLQAFFEGCP